MNARTRAAPAAVLEAPAENAYVPGRRDASSEPGRAAAALAALKLLCGVCIVVLVSLAVAWGAWRYALTTPRFALERIELEGARRSSSEALARQAGITLGQNILAIDTETAQKRILDDPWVREARVVRKLPGTLRVELAEREAVALAVFDDRLYLVSRTGEPFKSFDPEQSDPHDLPLITGVSGAELGRDRAAALERLAVALDVLRQYERLPASRVHPAEEVHLAEDGQVVLSVGKQGVALHLGAGPWARKLAMADRVLSDLSRAGRVPGILFLDNRAHPERVVVRMR
jgi:cell division protein FtsQ